MSSESFKRKLSAILSADVAGYSRLMRDDEEATVRTLKNHKKMIFNLIERNQGRLVDSTGDNLLAEFSSVVNAVRCAVQIQEDLKAKNDGLDENRKMEFRIGINLGDVIQEGNRIYGDGVNVASRIESLADAGGICISRSVYNQVKRKLNLKYEDIGEHQIKNIDEPVQVYKVLMDSVSDEVLQEKRSRGPDAEAKMAYSLSGKPSIAVLPFVNISGDPEQEYFSDGMTEELINALSNLEGLKVISRTSSFYFKGKDVKLRQVGEELNVDNVLEGSVRKAGNKLRITAQLIQVADDTHLWSETYNREIEDVFAIQEEISKAIVDKLKVQIFGKEKEPIVKTYTENMEAYESFIKGRYLRETFMEGGLEKALQYYEQAITLDPNYAPAYSAIAEWYFALPFMGRGASREDGYTKAKEAINKALEIDNNLPEAHSNLGLIRWVYEWDWKGAREAFEKAIDLNPGSSKSHYDYALYLAWVGGNNDKAISEARKAVELDPLSGNGHYIFGECLFALGQFDQATEQLRYAREMAPTYLPAIADLVRVYIERGLLEEAIEEIEEGLRLFPKNPWLLELMGSIYTLKGEKEKARAILDELLEISETEYVSSLAIACLYTHIGEMDYAFEYLERGYEKRDIFFAFIKIRTGSTGLHLLRTDPRFIALLKKMGLEP